MTPPLKFALLLVLPLSSLASQTPPQRGPERYNPFWLDGETVVFESNEGGKYGLWHVKLASQSPATAWIRPDFDIQQASLSPDGTQIAFVSNRDGPLDIFTMRIDGTGIRNLTSDSVVQIMPKWSADGRTLLHSARPAGSGRSYAVTLLDIGSAVSRRLLPGFERSQMGPAWHPDGRRFVFGAQGVLHIGNSSDGAASALTLPGGAGGARYSTTGHLVFHATTDGNMDIWAADGDGRNPRRLTTAPGNDWMPAWSPNGEWIAFVAQREGRHEIRAIRADGTSERCLAGCLENAMKDK